MARSFIAALWIALMGAVAFADAPKLLTWEDLVPEGPPIDNPFLELEEHVRWDLDLVASWRSDVAQGFIEEGSLEHDTLIKTEKALNESGVDIEAMLAAVKELDAEIARRGYDTDTALAGQVVRMPGYALPLEASPDGVREFLLVPYVGACIHAPPPPPNQTVFVTAETPYKPQALFDPVWITGRIELEAGSRSLTFVDGTANVPTGYTLRALVIEPYE